MKTKYDLIAFLGVLTFILAVLVVIMVGQVLIDGAACSKEARLPCKQTEPGSIPGRSTPLKAID